MNRHLSSGGEGWPGDALVTTPEHFVLGLRKRGLVSTGQQEESLESVGDGVNALLRRFDTTQRRMLLVTDSGYMTLPRAEQRECVVWWLCGIPALTHRAAVVKQGFEVIGLVDHSRVHPLVPYTYDHRRHEAATTSAIVTVADEAREVHLMPVGNRWGKQVRAVKKMLRTPRTCAVPEAALIGCAIRQPHSGSTPSSGDKRTDTPDVSTQLVRIFVSLQDKDMMTLAQTYVYEPKPIRGAGAARTIAFPPPVVYRGKFAPANVGAAITQARARLSATTRAADAHANGAGAGSGAGSGAESGVGSGVGSSGGSTSDPGTDTPRHASRPQAVVTAATVTAAAAAAAAAIDASGTDRGHATQTTVRRRQADAHAGRAAAETKRQEEAGDALLAPFTESNMLSLKAACDDMAEACQLVLQSMDNAHMQSYEPPADESPAAANANAGVGELFVSPPSDAVDEASPLQGARDDDSMDGGHQR